MNNITTDLIKKLRMRTGVGILICKEALLITKGNIELAIDYIRKLELIKTEKKTNILDKEGIILSKTSLNNDYGVIIEISCETDFTSKSYHLKDLGKKIITYATNEFITDINIIKKQFKKHINILCNQTKENINIKRLGFLKNKNIIAYTHNMRIGVIINTNENNNNTLLKQIAMHIAASKPEYIAPDYIPKNILSHEYKIQLDIAKKTKKPNNVIDKIVEGRIHKFKSEICLINQNFIINPNKTVGQILKENKIKINKFIRFELNEIIK